jgi:hypothetical protein
MEFKSRFEVGDIVYFYDNERAHMFNDNRYLEPHGMFILEGEVIRIIVDYMGDNMKLKQPFIIYKVRIGGNIIEDVHEDFLANDIDELAEQSKKYFVSRVQVYDGKKKKK